MSTAPVTRQISTGLRWSVNRWPETSEMVSGTSSAAQTAHTAAPIPARRTAR